MTGPGGAATIAVELASIATLEVHFSGPGAVSSLVHCPDSLCAPTCAKACGIDGCGGSCGVCEIPSGGTCDGATFVKCDAGCPWKQDCASEGKICGFADWLNDAKGGHGCLEPGTGTEAP